MALFEVEQPNVSLLTGIVSIGGEGFSCINTGLEWQYPKCLANRSGIKCRPID